MNIVQTGMIESLREMVKNVDVANKVTHTIWKEDGSLLAYAIQDDVSKTITVYPVREVDIGQMYAELDARDMKSYSILIDRSDSMDLVTSINVAESSLDIDGIKELKISRMKNLFDSIKIRPRVPVLVTDGVPKFFVDGSKDDLTNFQSYLDILVLNDETNGYVKDAYGNMQPITTDDLQHVINEIKQYGLYLYQLKWNKETEILGASSIEEVKSININLI